MPDPQFAANPRFWMTSMRTLAVLVLIVSSQGLSQVVQLPTTGTFSLQTSVLAPDSGSAFLGGNRTNSIGSRSLGPASAIGASRTAGGASVYATIIDLNELDQMIRSQAGSKPTPPNFSSSPTKASPYSSSPRGKPAQNAAYEYLAALTHPGPVSQPAMSSDTNYYLSLANNAKQKEHWASVELYYKLAWGSLPENRRANALKSLEEAKMTADAKDPKTAPK